MKVFSFFATVMLAFANGLTCDEYKSAYDEAVNEVCNKREGITGISCQTQLKTAKQYYFQCLNGNLDADKITVQSGYEEDSACVKFGDLTIFENPELKISSGEIVLLGGLSREEQLAFKPWKLVTSGKHPAVYGRTWAKDILSTLDEKGKFSEEEKKECVADQPAYLGNASPVPEDPSDYCKDPCRWHSDMTIKPYEGMSQALVKSFYNISYEDTHRNEIYVLLNKWSPSSVFAQTELVTFLKQEMNKDLDWSLHHKAGTLNIRLRKNAYVDEETSDEFDPEKMVEVDGANHYKATCKDIVKFVLDEQEKELQANGFTGYKLVCIKCYENCGADFRTNSEGGDDLGSCISVASENCYVKDEL